MRKKILFIITIFIGICIINVQDVYAKEILMTCDYYKPYDNSDSFSKASVECTIYKNMSHSCTMKVDNDDDNLEEIINWNAPSKPDWNASNHIKMDNKCPSHLVFKMDSGVNGYQIYAVNSSEDANDLIADLGSNWYVADLSNEYHPSEDSTNPSYESDDPIYSVTDTDINTICNKPEYRKPMKFLGTVLNFVKIIVPIVVIFFGALDLFKVISSKDGAIQKSLKSLAIRVVAGVFIFLLPGIVQFILNMVNEWSEYKNSWCCCTDCLLNQDCDVNSCNSDSCHIEGTN